MALFKILTNLLIIGVSSVIGSGLLSPILEPAVASVAYAPFIPPNVPPYATSVATFAKGLNVYGSPYAPGFLAAPEVFPTSFLSSPLGRSFPAAVSPAVVGPGITPNVLPAIGPAPLQPFADPIPAPLFPGGYAAAPSLVPAPFALTARSIHAVAPVVVPGVAPAISPAAVTVAR